MPDGRSLALANAWVCRPLAARRGARMKILAMGEQAGLRRFGGPWGGCGSQSMAAWGTLFPRKTPMLQTTWARCSWQRRHLLGLIGLRSVRLSTNQPTSGVQAAQFREEACPCGGLRGGMRAVSQSCGLQMHSKGGGEIKESSRRRGLADNPRAGCPRVSEVCLLRPRWVLRARVRRLAAGAGSSQIRSR